MIQRRNSQPFFLALVLLTAGGLALIGLLVSASAGQAAPAYQTGGRTATPVSVGIIEYVVDLSASMSRPLPDGDTIWDKTLASIFTYEDYMLGTNLAIGLRTFGYPDLSCEQQKAPSAPVVFPRLGTGPVIVKAMGKIVPNPSSTAGGSAILKSLSKAMEDVSSISAAAGQNRSIILFTDGKENCMTEETDRQAWLEDYLAQVSTLAATGVHVKTFVLTIVADDENICEMFADHTDVIACIPVSAVDASKLPGIVEAIRVETVFENTPTPQATATETSLPTFTPTPTDYIFHEVPTGEALPTLNKTLFVQAATPVIEPESEASTLDPKMLILPVGLVLVIVVGLLVVFAMNMAGGRKR